MRTNFTKSGPQRLAKLEEKIKQWHTTWVECCQDKLFQRDTRWTKKSENLQVGDLVWQIQDSKLAKKLNWGLVKQTCPDFDGVEESGLF